MRKQYDYRTYNRAFRISEEAFEALREVADKLGTLEIHREHVPDASEPTVEVDGETRDHYGTDHLWITPGGDVFRRRVTHTDEEERLNDGDTHELFGHSQSPDDLLDMVYGEEWERQEYDDKQYYWFEWRVGNAGDLPEEFIEELPRHIPRSADPEELDD